MKPRHAFTCVFLILATPFVTSAGPGRGGKADQRCLGCRDRESRERPCAFVPDVLPDPARLEGTAQLDLLRRQLAEEVMAAQVYRALGATYTSVRPFQNIPAAEDQHAASLRALLVAAHVELPPVGTLTDPAFISRRDALIAQGRTDEINALRVGIQIEETDLADLHIVMAATSDGATLVVLRALEAGSRHHLAAFVRQLSRRGIEYIPTDA